MRARAPRRVAPRALCPRSACARSVARPLCRPLDEQVRGAGADRPLLGDDRAIDRLRAEIGALRRDRGLHGDHRIGIGGERDELVLAMRRDEQLDAGELDRERVILERLLAESLEVADADPRERVR